MFILLLLSCSLKILYSRDLLDIEFVNMFSYFVNCTFTFLIMCFDAQKVFFFFLAIIFSNMISSPFSLSTWMMVSHHPCRDALRCPTLPTNSVHFSSFFQISDSKNEQFKLAHPEVHWSFLLPVLTYCGNL